MATWIASADNPLTARVIVNRVWQYHFGEGIVRTPSDFGVMGATPTHPELLDWLAHLFVHDADWSLMVSEFDPDGGIVEISTDDLRGTQVHEVPIVYAFDAFEIEIKGGSTKVWLSFLELQHHDKKRDLAIFVPLRAQQRSEGI